MELKDAALVSPRKYIVGARDASRERAQGEIESSRSDYHFRCARIEALREAYPPTPFPTTPHPLLIVWPLLYSKIKPGVIKAHLFN